MSKNLKISLALIAVAIGAVVVAATVGGGDDETAAPAAADVQVVRPDSQRLSVADGDLTFVEFLDFECEACRAAHPAIEQLRKDYGDQVTFVVRHMPLHNNSERAARAAEAAGAQGKFEEMYDRLFETQPEWGESRDSKEDVFFGLAEQLDLDMAQFEDDYNDAAIIERVRRDKAEGAALGVTGTPTFFLDGEKLEISSFDDLVQEIEASTEG